MIYQSNNNGPFEIIGPKIIKDNHKVYVRIRFINTGFEKECRLDTALRGAVKDDLYGIDFNKIYMSNTYGPFKIIRYAGRDEKEHGRRLVEVEFINTGYRTVVTHKAVKLGYVVDPTLGHRVRTYGNNFSYDKIRNILLQTWTRMMRRCYDETVDEFKTYKGVTVDARWHDKETFLEDCKLLFQYDKFLANPYYYQIDKDYKQQHIPKRQRIYSVDTCVFLSILDNRNLAIIERVRNGTTKNRYYGVSQSEYGMFRAVIMVNGTKINIGSFSNEIAAANAYNYYAQKYHTYDIIPLFNDVPYMSPDEFIKYNNRPKEMVQIISKEEELEDEC